MDDAELRERLERIEQSVSRYKLTVAAFCGAGWAVLLTYLILKWTGQF